MVFGEGIVNDAVAIILFNSVAGFLEKSADSHDSTFDWITPFEILWNFIKLGVVSILIGLLIGLLGSYSFKKFRFLTVSAIKETFLIFCYGYLAYSISDLCKMSGIISLLTAGVIMAHYGWYNLSPQGKHVSSVAV